MSTSVIRGVDHGLPNEGSRGVAVSKALAGRHLVVVDDTAIIKLGIEQALREAGATIERSFENGADAAILDIWLGKGTTSLFIAQALVDRKIPFLFYTGLPRSELTPIRERWPGCMIVAKPAPPSEIVAAVVELLRGSALGGSCGREDGAVNCCLALSA